MTMGVRELGCQAIRPRQLTLARCLGPATPLLAPTLGGGREQHPLDSSADLEELPMRILLANPRGFCAGVIMAIESLERTLQLLGPPVYIYHEIIHNKNIVEQFRHK